ncbi:alpha/beta hydrolase fold domain-containing protein, partial [Escherichia coli]|uniref:alpha/beta hydrolase fold domain-containing protein n=1 Tax=Escherichia coli TaxID=562 RepID=UPI0021198A49|nr:alpha/beta hydrolase fold domain-containing protein [Escherichia coli]
DIDAALGWLARQPGIDPKRLAYMGYSYGGGVAMLRALSSQTTPTASVPAPSPSAKAVVLVYPDCALADSLGSPLTLHQPT